MILTLKLPAVFLTGSERVHDAPIRIISALSTIRMVTMT